MMIAPPATPLTAADLAARLADLAHSPRSWAQEAIFDASGRWWKRIEHSADLDIWLLTWLSGHSTDLHDHGGSAGAFTVLYGALTEVRVSPNRLGVTKEAVKAGTSVQISPVAIHDVYNAGPAAAVSLHAYSPPLTRMTYYARHAGGVTSLKTVGTRDQGFVAA